MSTASRIEWTQATWNPVTGCDRISPGCEHCYALTLAGRLKAMGQAKYQTDGRPPTSGPGFGVATHPTALAEPHRWRAPRLVFVNSMSDLFHAHVPDGFILDVFTVMAIARRHTFQVLTKRPRRMRNLLADPLFSHHVRDRAMGRWPLPNVWLGTSVESQRWADLRIPTLLETPATARFLSCEPLLGPLDISPWLACHCPEGPASMPVGCAERAHPANARRSAADATPIDWVIVGGESGPRARPMDPQWARDLRDQCQAAGVPFFFKQWGGRTPKAGGRLLDGRTWNQLPPTVSP